MTSRLTQKMRYKIAVWQEAYKSVGQTQRLFNREFGNNSAPTRRTIYAIHRKFMESGSVVDAQRSGRPKSGRSEENIRVLEEAYALSQRKSIRRAAVELEISRSSIQRILRKDIKAFPYKLQAVHKLEEEDNDRRVEMCETLLYHYENDPSLLDNIWFSDEAVFHLSGRVNRHNTPIWGTENPKVIEEKERDSPKLVVWCAISATGIIGPYFFRDDTRRTTTVTGENYLEMLQKFFLPELGNNALVENCYFQQDGAPAHYARKVRDYLNQVFPDRWIGRRGPLEWAARSPDLTPCDFCFGVTLKVKSTPHDLKTLKSWNKKLE